MMGLWDDGLIVPLLFLKEGKGKYFQLYDRLLLGIQTAQGLELSDPPFLYIRVFIIYV